MRYLLDTDTCVDVLRTLLPVTTRLATIPPDEVAVSTVTVYELSCGVEKCWRPERERAKVQAFLGATHVLPFLAPAGVTAARIRARLETRGESIGPYDYLLAGQALAAGLTLVTANTREFGRVPGLALENWRTSQRPGDACADIG